MQVAPIVEMLQIGQSGLKRVIGIRGSLCHRVVVGSLLVTVISSENKPVKVVDSSSYGGSISDRYIREELSRSSGRKGPCARV